MNQIAICVLALTAYGCSHADRFTITTTAGRHIEVPDARITAWTTFTKDKKSDSFNDITTVDGVHVTVSDDITTYTRIEFAPAESWKSLRYYSIVLTYPTGQTVEGTFCVFYFHHPCVVGTSQYGPISIPLDNVRSIDINPKKEGL